MNKKCIEFFTLEAFSGDFSSNQKTQIKKKVLTNVRSQLYDAIIEEEGIFVAEAVENKIILTLLNPSSSKKLGEIVLQRRSDSFFCYKTTGHFNLIQVVHGYPKARAKIERVKIRVDAQTRGLKIVRYDTFLSQKAVNLEVYPYMKDESEFEIPVLIDMGGNLIHADD